MKTDSIIKQIKQCGQSLIDNAEEIAEAYKYQTDLMIDISIGVAGEEIPSISINKTFIPEKFILGMQEE